MNGNDTKAAAPVVSPTAIACGNCLFWQLPNPNGTAQCFRYPPQIIAMLSTEPDVVRGQHVNVQRPMAIRPSMHPNEFCGDFRPPPSKVQ